MALVKYNNNSISSVTAAAALPAGAMTLIKSITASSSSTISFVDGSSSVVLDDTYKEYLFTFNNIHPSATAKFQINFSADGGSNYNVTKTTTAVQIYHAEGDDADTGFGYSTGGDLAQGTGVAQIGQGASTGNDESLAGYLYLFAPSSTTYVKHFIADTVSTSDSYAYRRLHAGYGNTTSAIDAVQFSQSTGNMDAGTIKLYGIKDS